MRRPTTLVLSSLLLAAPLTGCMEAVQDLQDQFFGGRVAPGQLAEDYIRGDDYSKLLIEIDHVPGSAPHQEALDKLRSAAETHLDKDSVEIQTTGEVEGKGQDYKYSLRDEVVSMEDRYRDHETKGDTAVLYMIYVDGGSERDDSDRRVLGTAYFGSSVVMYKGNIRDSSCTNCGIASTKPNIKFVERAVIVHELGHNLGLVDSGIPAQNENRIYEGDGCDCHSKREKSVMYYAVESSNINNVFSGGSDIPYRFDQYDEQDIRNVREGGS